MPVDDFPPATTVPQIRRVNQHNGDIIELQAELQAEHLHCAALAAETGQLQERVGALLIVTEALESERNQLRRLVETLRAERDQLQAQVSAGTP